MVRSGAELYILAATALYDYYLHKPIFDIYTLKNGMDRSGAVGIWKRLSYTQVLYHLHQSYTEFETFHFWECKEKYLRKVLCCFP